MTIINLRHIGCSYYDWLRSLEFYKQELEILKERLSAIWGRKVANEVAAAVEQYENRFMKQQDNIDRLQNDIRNSVKAMSDQIQLDHTGYLDSELAERHQRISEDFASEEKVVNDLRQDFNHFSAAWA